MPIIQTQISAGIQPTGTKTITANGVVDVTDYASADVQVPIPDCYLEFDKNGTKVTKMYTPLVLNGITEIGAGTFTALFSGLTIYDQSITFLSNIEIIRSQGCMNLFKQSGGNYTVDLSSLTTIGTSGCDSMFSNSGIKELDLSSLVKLDSYSSCLRMCENCTNLTSANLSNLTTVSGNCCHEMFRSCTNLTFVDLSNLTTVSGNQAFHNAFNGCTSLTSINLSSLESISDQNVCREMFKNCTDLATIDLTSLKSIYGQYSAYSMFEGTKIINLNLNNLESISGQYACQNMFYNSNLQSIYFPLLIRSENNTARQLTCSGMFGNCSVVDLRHLQYVGDYGILDSMFYLNNGITTINLNALEYIGTEAARTLLYITDNTSYLTDLYFPMLINFGTNPFYSNALYGRQNLTVHFRKDIQSTIEALPNYATLWGASTGTSVVFDLAGTLTGADDNAYTRNEKDSVYASETAGAVKTATAWTYNDTVYYTDGAVEPQVNDTIYSDSTLTTPVTTIDSIA